MATDHLADIMAAADRLRQDIPGERLALVISPAQLKNCGVTLEEARRVAREQFNADLFLVERLPEVPPMWRR